jgi:hypothetical protein
VDAGGGWRILALPPAELGGHPGEIQTLRWGRKTTIALPSGGHIGLYQPLHPTAI